MSYECPRTIQILRCPRCDKIGTRNRRSHNVGKWRVKHTKHNLMVQCFVCGHKLKFVLMPGEEQGISLS